MGSRITMIVPYLIQNIITFQIAILIINGKHMKMFRLKCDQNCTKNEELDFFEGRCRNRNYQWETE